MNSATQDYLCLKSTGIKDTIRRQTRNMLASKVSDTDGLAGLSICMVSLAIKVALI